MNVIIKTGFAAINHEIEFRTETIKKGKALAVIHVVRVEEIRVNGISEKIQGSVIRQTSVNSPPYSVKLMLNSNRKVTSVSCTCVSQAGGKCKHVFALIHYVNTDRSISKTNLEQEWGKPSESQIAKDLYAKGLAVTDYYKTKISKKNVNCLPYDLKSSDLNHSCALRLILREKEKSEGEKICKSILGDCITFAVTSSQDRNLNSCIRNVIDKTKKMILYFGDKLDNAETKLLDFYRQEILLSESEIIDLCLNTKNQAHSQEWFDARYLRISASSKAYSIKCRKTKTIEKLLKEMFDPIKVVGKAKKNFAYGRKNESVAISEYEKIYNAKIVKVGLFVLQSHPWLCASPDGIIVVEDDEMKILEIKCPITCEKKPIFDKATNTFNVPYLKKINNVDQLNPTHQYYTQCQIEMYVTGLLSCDFYVWSPCGSFLINVQRNESFLKNVIPILENFYFQYYLKELYQRKKNL